jgi:hypothetical protein
VLAANDLMANGRKKPRYRFFVTDEPAHFNNVGHRFLGQLAGSVERAYLR